MATVNLGAIKFKWKGTYNASTAYTIDDVVEYNGSSYICIQASTSNLPTDTAYFEQMSAKGTAGTDFSTILTTQGDLLYRDGSGIQRLGSGTSGQVLQTGGTGANPSWVDAGGGDVVKLAGVDLSNSTATSYDFTQFMNDSVYRSYKIHILQRFGSNSGMMRMRFLNNTTAYSGSTDYRYVGFESTISVNNNYSSIGTSNDGNGNNLANLTGIGHGNNAYINHYDIDIMGLPTGTSYQTGWSSNSWGTAYVPSEDYVWNNRIAGILNNTGVVDGVQFSSTTSSQLGNTQFTIWGLKK
jgi:hypothetical protein